nr:retrotransposon Gag domain-containing protein [Tanacetum cinerariifolium]
MRLLCRECGGRRQLRRWRWWQRRCGSHDGGSVVGRPRWWWRLPEWGRRWWVARGGEWHRGSSRSGDGEYFWGSSEMFFGGGGGGGGGGRRWGGEEDFKRRPMDQRHDRFTPLIKTTKEILAMKSRKGTFVSSPPMLGAPEARNKNKYCDFHKDKRHNTDDCLHLKIQIEEAVMSGKLAHLVKEIKQGSNKASTSKAAKNPDAALKDKGSAIFSVQSWGRNVHSRSVVHTPPQMNISSSHSPTWTLRNIS